MNFREFIDTYFDKCISVLTVSSDVYKLGFEDFNLKLEVFGKGHKLSKSLPIHEVGLSYGLRLPKIIEVRHIANKTFKVTEWVEGNTILDEMTKDPSKTRVICRDLGRYVNELYDVNGITAVDSHFKNFVWSNGQVVYIDLKKLLHRNADEHILQMSKICLKGCRGDRKKTLAFLIGYSKYRDVTPIIEDCDSRGWQWLTMKKNTVQIEAITLEETNENI